MKDSLDAEALYRELLRGVQQLGAPAFGVVNVALHRDDYAKKGLHSQASPTSLPFEVGGARIVLVDDVLYTGRTVRAATPQPTIRADSNDARLAAAQERVREWQPDALVVGVPFHPDGASHDNTARARKFARQLAQRTKLPVYEVDERYSTTEAESAGATDPDAGAACVILEQFLRSLP